MKPTKNRVCTIGKVSVSQSLVFSEVLWKLLFVYLAFFLWLCCYIWQVTDSVSFVSNQGGHYQFVQSLMFWYITFYSKNGKVAYQIPPDEFLYDFYIEKKLVKNTDVFRIEARI